MYRMTRQHLGPHPTRDFTVKQRWMQKPCVLLLPNSESFFFSGRCGDINLTGVNIDTDPCVRDGTDGTYELRLTKKSEERALIGDVEKKGGDMINLKSDLIYFTPERLIAENESLTMKLFPDHDNPRATLIFGRMYISKDIKFSSTLPKFKEIPKTFKGFNDLTNKSKRQQQNLTLLNGRMGKWMTSRRKDHSDLSNGQSVII